MQRLEQELRELAAVWRERRERAIEQKNRCEPGTETPVLADWVREGLLKEAQSYGKAVEELEAILARQPEAAGAVDAEALARLFHETYERLAPSFGYETRADTKAFDPASANGRLMIAVIAALREQATPAEKVGCKLGCADTCKAEAHGVPSECPDLSKRPTPAGGLDRIIAAVRVLRTMLNKAKLPKGTAVADELIADLIALQQQPERFHCACQLAKRFNMATPAGATVEGRDVGGRIVREAWVKWALTQPNPKPSWLVPYDQLSEPDKEADRQIYEACVASALAQAAPGDGLVIEPGEFLFQFKSKADWINRAQRIWKRHQVRADDTICVDTKGRLVNIGKHFMDAERDGAYPIKVYRLRADMNTPPGDDAAGGGR